MTTRENLDLGASANDGTGDTLRSGGQKINRNFVKIWQMLGSDSDNLSENLTLDSDGIVYSGNTNTSRLQFDDPSANRTVYIPDADGALVLDSAGQTLSNKQLNLPLVVDSSGNEILGFSKVASAVNHAWVTNAAANGSPLFQATGDDTNIHLELTGKGTGSVYANKLAVDGETVSSNGAASLEVGLTVFNSGTSISVTLNNGSVIGEQKTFINRGAGNVTVTPSSFGQGTSFDMAQGSACNLMWDSASWYIFSAYNDSDITVT